MSATNERRVNWATIISEYLGEMVPILGGYPLPCEQRERGAGGHALMVQRQGGTPGRIFEGKGKKSFGLGN